MTTRDTSLAAADSIAEVASQIRARVFYEIKNLGGATCDEIEVALDLRHQTASARVNELMEAGSIADSGTRRPTRSGSKAIVWTVAAPRLVQTVLPTQSRIAHTLEEVEALGGYSLVYADPPWSYVQGGRGSIDGKYKGMSVENICALPIHRLASKDSVLFMWVTWPCLPEALQTIAAWGFRFKTCAFVWVKYREPSGKNHVGGGFWTRANTEFCLIGVRGKNHPKRLDTSKGVRQLIEEWPEEPEVLKAPLEEHSAKPAEARIRIEKLMGDLSRIELFARERVENWDAFGNDSRLGGSDVSLEIEKGGERNSAVEIESENENNDNEQGEETMAFFPPGFGYETAKKEATISRQRLNDGDYVMMHKQCFVKNTKAGDAIIIEHEIVEAKKAKEGVEPSPVGTTWGYFLPLYGDAAVMAQPNMKAYALGLYGLDEKKVKLETLGEMIDAIGAQEQSARGMLIRGITFHTNKKDGDDFMGMNWSSIPGENVAGSPNVLARRAKLDSLAGAAAPGATNGATAGVPTAPGAVPSIPAAPSANPLQAAIAAGWQKHPASPGHWYLGQVVKTEADLIAGR